MDARATRRGVPAVMLWGGFGALAWAALTVLTGGGSAHADEQKPNPLESLTTAVTQTVTAVTAPVVNKVVAPVVTQVVAPVVTHVAAPVATHVAAPVVTDVVAPVVKEVAAPVQQAAPAVVDTVTENVNAVPVVGAVTAPVLGDVAETAEHVIDPVTGLLSGSPVSGITDPVLDLVKGVPLVGRVVVDAGVADLVDDIADLLDETTDVVGEVTDGTVPPVLEALTPRPVAPTIPDPPLGLDPVITPVPVTASEVSLAAAQAHATRGSTVPGSLSGTPTPDRAAAGGSSATAPPAGAPEGSPAGDPAAPVSSAGPGGGSATAHARVSDLAYTSLRAWERVAGTLDDALPGSPVADTDVSPD